MYQGKKKCEILKDIRRQLAEENGIQYVPAECHHEGDCPGTCPRCDAELKQLEADIKAKNGGQVKISKIAAVAIGGMVASSLSLLTSCAKTGIVERPVTGLMLNDTTEVLDGEVEPMTTVEVLDADPDSCAIALRGEVPIEVIPTESEKGSHSSDSVKTSNTTKKPSVKSSSSTKKKSSAMKTSVKK